MKIKDSVKDAKSNLENFINPPNLNLDQEYMDQGFDWLDPAIILLVLFGGISLGIACISAIRTI